MTKVKNLNQKKTISTQYSGVCACAEMLITDASIVFTKSLVRFFFYIKYTIEYYFEKTTLVFFRVMFN